MMTLLTEKPGNLFLADAPGLRDQRTPYAKVKLNLVLLKQAGPDNWFISLVESSDAVSRIHSCRLLKTSVRSARAVEVVTADGIDLIVLAAPGTGAVEIAGFPQYRITGRSAVIRLTPEKRLRSFWQENAPSRGIVTRIDGHVLHTSLDTLPQTGYLLAEKHPDGLYRIASAHMQDNKAVVTVASDEVVRLEPGDPIQVYNYLIRLPTDGKP